MILPFHDYEMAQRSALGTTPFLAAALHWCDVH